MNTLSDSDFCLIPKGTLRQVGSILFVRYSGVVVPGPVTGTSTWPESRFMRAPQSSITLWIFLQKNPKVMVVLLADKNYRVTDAKEHKLRPNLGSRIIGATDTAHLNPLTAINRWLAKYAGDIPYAFLDNRVDQYSYHRCLVPIIYETGLTTMDLEKTRELLNLAEETLFSESRTDIENLVLAAELHNCGQQVIPKLLLDKLIKKIDARMPLQKFNENGSDTTSIAPLIGSESINIKMYRIANLLGVRLRVTAESSN